MANLLYKTFGEKNVKRAGKAIKEEWDNFTGETASKRAAATARSQMAEQERYAREGLQWKVADATAAGIHPLYALGGSGPSYSPVSVDTPQVSNVRSLMEMGQGISSVSKLFSSREKKIADLQLRAAELEVEDKELDVSRKKTALALSNQPGNPPAYDPGGVGTAQGIPGQTSTNSLIAEKAMERVKGYPGTPHQEPGSKVFQGFARTSTGWMPVPSSDLKELTEDQFIPETISGLRMYFGPNFKPDPPAGVKVPKGMVLEWQPHLFEYQLRKKNRTLGDKYYEWSTKKPKFIGPQWRK